MKQRLLQTGVWAFFTMLGLQGSLHATDLNMQEYMDDLHLLISADAIKNKVEEVARVLDNEYQGEAVTVVMVMKGALCVTADLIRKMKAPITVEYIRANSYGMRGKARGELKIVGLEELDLTEKNVLLIDDIFDTGMTLSQIEQRIQVKQPKTLKTLVLLRKNIPREISYNPDYVLFDIEDRFVIGYGLDYKELYRGLPGIYYITSDEK